VAPCHLTVQPETKYAKSGEVHIAYQVFGDGPVDLVYVPGSVTHLDLMWEDPGFARYYRRLGEFSRVILFDKRGTGLSDRAAGIATLEERMDDVRAVMDAVGSQQAAIMGVSEGGPMSILFAATYPERTRALVLYGTNVTGRGDADFPWRGYWTDEEVRKRLNETPWDSSDRIIEALAGGAPSVAQDPAVQQWWLRMYRAGASPAAARALAEMNMLMDVRPILGSIRTPTLVINLTDGPARGVRCARAIVEETRQIGIDIRTGLHTGEIEIAGDGVAGIAVHIGQRVSALAAPCEVLVSRTVADLVAGSGLEFEPRGEHELKGVPGRWQLFAMTN
jgi:pimeloyl-ACP methyl ester carboxylesterase